MISKSPIVSIIVPSYNHEAFIENCIRSILNQTFKDFELIVIDDGSADQSVNLLLDLQKKYNFQLVIQENVGLVNTLNRGFRDLAKGKYFTFCASDDYWLPEKLQKQVDFMESHPDYAMVYGKVLIVDNKDCILEPDTTNENINLKGGRILKDLLLMNFHPPVNYLLRADVVKEMNYYRPEVWAEDFDMNLRISSKYPIGFINDYLFCYRKPLAGKGKLLSFKTVYSHLNSINLFRDLPYYKDAVRRWNYRCFLWYCGYKRTKVFALKCMFKSLRFIIASDFQRAFILLFFKWK